MKRDWYAVNARDLLEHRKHGELPTNPVSVVVGRGEAPYPALYLHDDMPLERMDWRMLVNLDVWLWAGFSVPLERIKRIAKDIAQVQPSVLILRFADTTGFTHDVELAFSTHQPGYPEHGIKPVHDTTWRPLNLTGSTFGTRLCAGLR